jgi:ABC-type nickel/cobalt efflux system permease component RcnA
MESAAPLSNMSNELVVLSTAALTVGFLHTLFGPDHYLPFVAMSRVGNWSYRKTIIITLLCGIGHVGSSVVLGSIGIVVGTVLNRLELIEETRGTVAGWLLIGFGLAYMVWGTMHGIRRRAHAHPHVHADGTVHSHPHEHQGEHLHVHEHAISASDAKPGRLEDAGRPEPQAVRLAPWILFTLFLFGPCEPLIPLLMYPAAQSSWWGVAVVTSVFMLATIGTMLAMVTALLTGARAVDFPWLHRYSHAFAGLVILACGLAVQFGL